MSRYFKKFKFALAKWIAGELGYALAMVYWSFFMKKLADVVFEGEMMDVKQLVFLGLGFLAFFFIIQYFRVLSRASFLKKSNYALKSDVFSEIIEQDINTFNDSNSSKYISILNNDLKAIEEDYLRNVPEIISDIILVVVAAITMVYYSPILAVVTILINLIPFIVPVVMGKVVSQKRKLHIESLEEFNTNIKDMFTGFEMVKSYNAEGKVKNRYNNIINDVENKLFHLRKKEGLSYVLSHTTGYLTGVIQLSFSVYLVVKGYITMGILMGTMQISNYVSNPAREATNMYMRFKSIKPVLKRVENILNKSAQENGINKELVKIESPIPIKLHALNFQYEEGKDVLSNVNFEFEKGKKYAIVGGSGSGKSTLVKLIMHYYDDFDGEIYLDNQEIREIDKGSLYQNITMIHQRVVLFDDSIKNNITMYQEYPNEEVIKAICDSGLDELVKKTDNGIYSKIEENGRNFSGGEQQRFAIARAFIRKTPVLILDEATSSLDNQTAYQIENLILNRENLTSIIVTHKLSESILSRFDCILVLNSGKIVESGSFDELMEKEGYFYNLYNVNNPTKYIKEDLSEIELA